VLYNVNRTISGATKAEYGHTAKLGLVDVGGVLKGQCLTGRVGWWGLLVGRKVEWCGRLAVGICVSSGAGGLNTRC